MDESLFQLKYDEHVGILRISNLETQGVLITLDPNQKTARSLI